MIGRKPLRCSFCGKGADEVRKLIAGPAAIRICDGCVGHCVKILDEDQVENRFADPLLAQTETLLAILQNEADKDGEARAALQAIVDALRGRGVSWTIIGATLGVSRQAAWDRFAKAPPAREASPPDG
jgi:hypothetical protein